MNSSARFDRFRKSAQEFTFNGVKVWGTINVSSGKDNKPICLSDFWVHFPKCRAPKQSGFPMIIRNLDGNGGKVHFLSLWDYSGSFEMTIAQFNSLVGELPVVSDWINPINITESLKRYARQNNTIQETIEREVRS